MRLSPSLAMFRGSSILIVEDEYFLADDLAQRFESAGAVVVGPAGSVEGSIRHVSRIGVVSAAVLDIRLGEELVFPVADLLSARSVPFVFYSGYDELHLPARFRHSRRLSKCASLDDIVAAVLSERAMAEALSDDMPLDVDRHAGFSAFLPRLRLMARYLTDDSGTADELVAEALERAVASLDLRPPQTPMLRWLLGLIEETWLRRMRQRLN